jgi:hypothetical protein
MVFMVFARVPEELLGVEVSDRSQRQSRLESLTKAVWTLIELCLRSRESILKPRASQLVYRKALDTQSVAGYDAFELVLFGRKRRMPHARSRLALLFASEAAG